MNIFKYFAIISLLSIHLARAGDLSDDIVNSTSRSSAKKVEEYKADIQSSYDSKVTKIKGKMDEEQKAIQANLKKLALGYVTSSVSLFAATLIGPQVWMVCKNKPSAILYAGTAAIYIAREIANFKIFKASQLAELEIVTDLTLDKNSTLKANIDEVKSKTEDQITYLKKYKKTLDNTFEAIKKKSSNAKMASAGFLAASVASLAEQLNFYSGGGACIATANQYNIKYLFFSNSLDKEYLKRISDAYTPQNKWANFYEWQSYRLGADHSLTPTEYQALKEIPELHKDTLTPILQIALASIQNSLISTVFATENDNNSKKVSIASSLKDNKAADWIGDLDKLGIVGAGATYLIAYITNWQMGFLKNIISNGTARSVIFAAQGAIALTASKIFDDTADEFIKRLNLIDSILDQMGGAIKKGLDLLILSDADSKRIQEVATKLGITSDKLINQMTIREADNFIGKILDAADEQIQGKLNDVEYDLIEKYNEKLKSASNYLDKVVENENDFQSLPYYKSFFDFVIPDAQAYVTNGFCINNKNCLNITILNSRSPLLQGFNQYLNYYENFSKSIFQNNAKESHLYERKMLRNKNFLIHLRENLYEQIQLKNMQKKTFSSLENKQKKIEQNSFNIFYQSLTPDQQNQFKITMNTFGADFSFNENLNDTSGTKTNSTKPLPPSLPNAEPYIVETEKTEEIDKDQELTIQMDTIHPADKNIFEIIHNQYMKYYDFLNSK